MSFFMPGDKVVYIGKKFSAELGTRVGEVISKIRDDERLVVEFEIKDVYHSYTCHQGSLRRVTEVEPEVKHRKSFKFDEDVADKPASLSAPAGSKKPVGNKAKTQKQKASK